MHQGGCLCGAVSYEISGDLGPLRLCHCSRCRKAGGSAFGAVLIIPAKNFRLLTGAEAVKSYESSPGVHRDFCGTCGSPLFARREAEPEVLRLRAGGLSTPVAGGIAAHIFTGSKAEWFEILDDAPQYVERP